jgi:hypothetical protein
MIVLHELDAASHRLGEFIGVERFERTAQRVAEQV